MQKVHPIKKSRLKTQSAAYHCGKIEDPGTEIQPIKRTILRMTRARYFEIVAMMFALMVAGLSYLMRNRGCPTVALL
jgi:hypothetical protein